MFCSTLLFVFILPILTHAHEGHGPELHEGACPKPPAALENLDVGKAMGRWYLLRTNYELEIDAKSRRECLEIRLEQEGSEVLESSNYRNQSSDNNLNQAKYRPIEGQPGRFSFHRRLADGSYQESRWTFTAVRIEGDSILKYACGEEDGHHRSFYRIYSRNIPAAQQEIDLLVQQVKDNGDNREMVQYNHENCQYKLN